VEEVPRHVTPALHRYFNERLFLCEFDWLSHEGNGTLNPLVEGSSPSALTLFFLDLSSEIADIGGATG
jgi:hypothetical protein